MKLYRYLHGQSPTLGVQVGDHLYNCARLFEEAGQQPPDVVLRADVRSICAAPDSVLIFLQQFLKDVKPAAAPNAELAVPLASARLLAPLPNPEKVVCIGLNYLDHCEEQNRPRPSHPMLFAKFANTIAGPTDDVTIPTNTQELDYEGELAFIIGKGGRNIAEADALKHIFGYMVMLDVSARDLQRTDGQWVRAKSQDGFAPCGPCIVTADEIPDPQVLGIETRVNGETLQKSNTSNMIFPIAHLVSFISQSLTLAPGDIVTTGTPAGVGVHRNPQVLLKDGDVVEVTLDHIGTLRNRFVGP